MRVVRVGPLPPGASDSAAEFYARVMPPIDPSPDGEDLVLIFAPAAYDHRGWRVAAMQDLARAAAPRRVNAVVGDDENAIAEAVAYLAAAPGVTGQVLTVDGNGGETRYVRG